MSEGDERGAEGDGSAVGWAERLQPDALGEAAERFFQYLCARAGMRCNPSEVDRTGWDFVVEIPHSEGLLDHRWKTTCHVQLKATAEAGGRVAMRLSSADLLAKGAAPALLVVLRTKPDGTPLRGHLVHLLGAPLAKLLRRLRHEEFHGRRDTNARRIWFDYLAGRPFEITPEGLRTAIEDACGPDPAAYALEKLRQLDELGYDGGRVVAEAEFQVEGEEHLARVVLGLQPVRPVRLQAYDVRFGMPVAYDGGMFRAVEEILLSPPSAGPCDVAVTGPPLTPAATFRAELLFAPLSDARMRMVIRHPDFHLLFRETEVAIQTNGVFGVGGRSLDDMIMLLRALSNLAGGVGSIVLTGLGGSFGPLRLPVADALSGPNVEDLPGLLRVATEWRRLLELAGMRSRAPIALSDLEDSRSVQIAADLLLGSPPAAQFAFDVDQIGGDGGSVTAVYFGVAVLAGEGVTYCVEVDLEPTPKDTRVYRSVRIRPKEIRAGIGDLHAYMEELRGRYERPILIHPDPARGGARRAREARRGMDAVAVTERWASLTQIGTVQFANVTCK